MGEVVRDEEEEEVEVINVGTLLLSVDLLTSDDGILYAHEGHGPQ